MKEVLWGLLAILGIIIAYLLFVVISISVFIREKDYKKDSKFYRFILEFTLTLAFFVMNVKIVVRGKEKLKGVERFLFVSNHRSNFDPMVSLVAFKKRQIAFISKPENLKLPIVGKIIRRCCFMSIDRENPRNAILTIRRASDLIKNDVVSVGVYPEGTRSKDCKLLPMHDGVLKIAQQAQVPIVVVATSGTERIKARSPFRRTKILLNVVNVISCEEVANKTTHELGSIIKDNLENALEGK